MAYRFTRESIFQDLCNYLNVIETLYSDIMVFFVIIIVIFIICKHKIYIYMYKKVMFCIFNYIIQICSTLLKMRKNTLILIKIKSASK